MTIPSQWRVVPLSSIAEVRLGRQRSPSRATGPDMCPYMRAANVTWHGIDVSDVKEMDFTEREREVFRLRRGDILLSEASGSASEVGKPAVWQEEVPGACFQNTLIRVRASDPREIPYLYWHFLSDALNGKFADQSRGTGIHHLGSKKMEGWPIILPPLAEQRRIVVALEAQFARLAEALPSLERAKLNITRARASTLRAAVEGRLVANEAARARAEGRDFEPAARVLARSLAVRHAKWVESGKGKFKEPAALESKALTPLPEGWSWATLEALAAIVGGITKDSKQSRGRSVPYLRVANVQRGRLNLEEIKTIVAPESKIEALRLQPGDVLLNEGGDRDKLGRGWIWSGQIPECIHQNHVFRARLWLEDLYPKYISHYANTQGDRYFVDQGKQTTNLASISLSNVKALPVALPPIAEQTRILAEVDRRLSVLDALELTVNANLTRCAKLRQSMLKRAFEGRLLPPGPTTTGKPNPPLSQNTAP